MRWKHYRRRPVRDDYLMTTRWRNYAQMRRRDRVERTMTTTTTTTTRARHQAVTMRRMDPE